MNKGVVRESNFELMRIALMFMVVFWHMYINIVATQNINAVSKIIWNILHYMLIIHINSFVLLTGYFQSRKEKVGISKILKLNGYAYFYKILFLVIFLGFNIKTLTTLEIVQIVQPITLYSQYWFISIYILLYLVSPYLNRLLNQFTKTQFRKFLVLLFIISSIIPTITHEYAYGVNNGFSLINFILMYSIGAYLNRFPIKESYLFSRLTSNARKLLFISSFLFLAFVNVLIYYFSFTLKETNYSILGEIASIIRHNRISYSNPITIIEAVFFFCYFSEIKIKSKIINSVSRVSLDIYLVHDNELLRSLYSGINKYLRPRIFGIRHIAYMMIVAIIIVIISIIIGYIRKGLFKLVGSLPFIKKFKQRSKEKVDSLGFNIVW